jgi:hypothetical protein
MVGRERFRDSHRNAAYRMQVPASEVRASQRPYQEPMLSGLERMGNTPVIAHIAR